MLFYMTFKDFLKLNNFISKINKNLSINEIIEVTNIPEEVAKFIFSLYYNDYTDNEILKMT